MGNSKAYNNALGLIHRISRNGILDDDDDDDDGNLDVSNDEIRGNDSGNKSASAKKVHHTVKSTYNAI